LVVYGHNELLVVRALLRRRCVKWRGQDHLRSPGLRQIHGRNLAVLSLW
jgi:hypothetical protein